MHLLIQFSLPLFFPPSYYTLTMDLCRPAAAHQFPCDCDFYNNRREITKNAQTFFADSLNAVFCSADLLCSIQDFPFYYIDHNHCAYFITLLKKKQSICLLIFIAMLTNFACQNYPLLSNTLLSRAPLPAAHCAFVPSITDYTYFTVRDAAAYSEPSGTTGSRMSYLRSHSFVKSSRSTSHLWPLRNPAS